MTVPPSAIAAAKPQITDAHRLLIKQAREAWALPHDEAKVERIQKIATLDASKSAAPQQECKDQP